MLAQASLAAASIRPMAKAADTKHDRVRAYVRSRLSDESAKEGRGWKSRVAREFGMSTAHISNVMATGSRGMGQRFVEQAAEYWGMTYAQLEAVALGRRIVLPPELDPPIETLLRKLSRDEGLPGLRGAIDAHDGRWKTSTILRALGTEWESVGGQPVGGWPALLDAIETNDIDKPGGLSKDAISAAKKQTRGRPVIPPAT